MSEIERIAEAGLRPDELAKCVYRAAIQWCSEKDRETFPEDITYFEHNWRSLPGMTERVKRAVQDYLRGPQ